MKLNNTIKYIIILLFGFFLTWKFNFSTISHKNKKNELVLIWNNNCYHIHHWIYCFAIIIFLYTFRSISIELANLIAFFLLGIASSDFLLYNDALVLPEMCSKAFTLNNTTRLSKIGKNIS